MTKHHIIISGTGRAGTTFLVQLLTTLGLDTGFPNAHSQLYSNCDGGMEWDIRHADAPYIIKSPWLCDYLDDVLERENLIIDHAIIPVRELYSAAESRREVTRRTDVTLFPGEIPGGLWHTEIPHEQEAVLAIQLYKLIQTISKHEIPMTLLYFPRLVNDPDYLYRKLEFMLNGITYRSFFQIFEQIVQPELVHHFSQASREEETSSAADENGE